MGILFSHTSKVVKKYLFLLLILLVFTMVVSGCSNKSESDPASITIAAAASLELPLLEIIETYLNQYSDTTINTSFSGSRIIEEQILRGAPIDLFISSSVESSSILEKKGMIGNTSVTTLLNNVLVLAAPAASDIKIASLAELKDTTIQTLGLGDPDSVPAGLYAKESLLYYNLFESLSERLIYTQDVRQVLTLLETNNIDAGFIYHTDFLSGRNIKKLLTIPPDSHSEIIYQAMLISQERDPKHKQAVQHFFSYLETEEAKRIFIDYGFSIP